MIFDGSIYVLVNELSKRRPSEYPEYVLDVKPCTSKEGRVIYIIFFPMNYNIF